MAETLDMTHLEGNFFFIHRPVKLGNKLFASKVKE